MKIDNNGEDSSLYSLRTAAICRDGTIQDSSSRESDDGCRTRSSRIAHRPQQKKAARTAIPCREVSEREKIPTPVILKHASAMGAMNQIPVSSLTSRYTNRMSKRPEKMIAPLLINAGDTDPTILTTVFGRK